MRLWILPVLLAGCASRPDSTALERQLEASNRPLRPLSASTQTTAQSALVVDSQAQLHALTGPLTWETLYAGIRAHAPDVQAAKARARAALSAIDGALAWADPRLSVEVAPETLNADTPGYRIAISQMVAWGAPRSAKAAQRHAEASEALAMLADLERHHLISSRTAFADYWQAYRSLALLRDEIGLLAEWEQGQLAAQASGGSAVDSARIAAQRLSLERQRLLLEDQLNGNLPSALRAMLGAEAGPLPPPAEEPPELLDLPSSAEAAELALGRPEVALATANVQRAQAELAAAEANGLPDTELMAAYSSMEDDDAMRFTLGVSIALPTVRSERLAQRAMARGALSAAQATLQQERANALRVLNQTLSRMRALDSSIRLLRDQELPLLRRAQDEARAAYAGGGTGLGELLETQRARLNGERELLQLYRDYSIWLGELECCIGVITLGDRP